MRKHRDSWILHYLADLELMINHAIPNVLKCTNPIKQKYSWKAILFTGQRFLNNPQILVYAKCHTIGILQQKLLYFHPMGFDKKFIELKNPLIPKYGKLFPMAFLTYGNIFSQIIVKRQEYPRLSHLWIQRDFSGVWLLNYDIFHLK